MHVRLRIAVLLSSRDRFQCPGSWDRAGCLKVRAGVALVAGNAAYPSTPLRNSLNDARDLSAALRELGFEVTLVADADLRSIDRAVETFVAGLQPGDVALFYYSGHGMQVNGENYLLPIDFRAQQEADVPYQAYSASRVHERMQAREASLSIVILDACRNNPFRGVRSASKGLAPMQTDKGSFIAFAAAPGQTASDNPSESNGLFTKHLLDALKAGRPEDH